jgi:hypothetical protein
MPSDGKFALHSADLIWPRSFQVRFDAAADVASTWAAAAGVPGAAPEDVLAPLVRVDCAAAFSAPPAAIVLHIFAADASSNTTRRLLSSRSSAPAVSLVVNVTVLLVAALPFDATAAEIRAADVAARTQAARGVAAVQASPLRVFNATCGVLRANVSLAEAAATRHVAPPEAPTPGSAWAQLPLTPLALLGAVAGGIAAAMACCCGAVWLRRRAQRRQVADRAAADRAAAHAAQAITWPQRKAALEREKPQQRHAAASWCLPGEAPPPAPPRAARDYYAIEHRGDARADSLLRLAGQRHLAAINADAAPASP